MCGMIARFSVTTVEKLALLCFVVASYQVSMFSAVPYSICAEHF